MTVSGDRFLKYRFLIAFVGNGIYTLDKIVESWVEGCNIFFTAL